MLTSIIFVRCFSVMAAAVVVVVGNTFCSVTAMEAVMIDGSVWLKEQVGRCVVHPAMRHKRGVIYGNTSERIETGTLASVQCVDVLLERATLDLHEAPPDERILYTFCNI